MKVRWAGVRTLGGLLKLALQTFLGADPAEITPYAPRALPCSRTAAASRESVGRQKKGGNNFSRHPTLRREHLPPQNACSNTASNCHFSAFPYFAKKWFIVKTM